MMFIMTAENHILDLQLLCLSPFQSGRRVSRVMVEKVTAAAEPLSQTIACI